jgi:hypothetical protein
MARTRRLLKGPADVRFLFQRRSRRQGHRLDPILKRRVYARDGRRCQYCGDTRGPFEVDHIYPRHHGGEDRLDNLIVSCLACNRAKGARVLRGRTTAAMVGNYRRERLRWRHQQQPLLQRSPFTWPLIVAAQLILSLLALAWSLLLIPLRVIGWSLASLPWKIVLVILGLILVWRAIA